MRLPLGLSWHHVAASILTYFISLAFYRLFLHPLARFPGPKLAAISRWFEAYYDVVLNGQFTFKLAELHKKYGPIIRISPWELHISDPAFFEQLYRHDGRWDKYAWAVGPMGMPNATLWTVDHDIHRHRRSSVSHYFSKANVGKRQEMIQERAQKLCERLDHFSGSRSAKVNLSAAIGALTRDVAADFVLGQKPHNLEKEEFNVGLMAILQSAMVWRVTKHVRWFGPLMMSLPAYVPGFLAKYLETDGLKAFSAYVEDVIQTTKDIMSSLSASEKDQEDLSVVHAILNSNLPPKEKEFNRMLDDIATISGAAFETTAQTMRLILFYVYSNPAILGRLRAEIAEAKTNNSKFDDKDDSTAGVGLSLVTLEHLPYLTAVLTEGLRLSPGVATRNSRIALDRDLMYGDWRIPAGHPIGMTTLLIHMDESLYPNPESFKPERWMGKEAKQQSGFVPFGRGTRSCLGMYLAWAELYIVVAALVQCFDFDFDGAGPEHVIPTSDQFIVGTANQSGLKVYVTSRDD